MTRMIALLLAAGLMAVAPSGRPDLSGVWNFSTGVPLQRPATFAARKLFTREEFDGRRTAILNALTAIARFMPAENVGLEWIDSTSKTSARSRSRSGRSTIETSR